MIANFSLPPVAGEMKVEFYLNIICAPERMMVELKELFDWEHLFSGATR